MRKTIIVIITAVVIIVLATSVGVLVPNFLIGHESTTTSRSSSSEVIVPPNSIDLVRIGYFANINHAPALIGMANGTFKSFLGDSTIIQSTLFTAGPTEMTALLAGKLDMAYVGPSPAVNSFIASNGSSLVIVSGVSSGGAMFIVRNDSGINSAKDFAGKTFAAPQLGNTQDIALRSYLLASGYNTKENGGNVTVVDTTNSNIVTLMINKQIDGAWVPEPWAWTLLAKTSSHIFLDERSLWPSGQFSTAELVVSSSFLNSHSDVVQKIVEANLYEINWINAHESQAAILLDGEIANLTSTAPLDLSIITNSLADLSFTYNPLESSVYEQATNAYELGFLGSLPSNLNGLFSLSILNQVLTKDGLETIQS